MNLKEAAEEYADTHLREKENVGTAINCARFQAFRRGAEWQKKLILDLLRHYQINFNNKDLASFIESELKD